MKKIAVYLVLLILPIMVMSGCNKRPSLDDRIGSYAKLHDGTYEGVIRKLASIDVYQQGTHMLVTEDDEIVIIQSRSIDLNKYLEEGVRIEGTVTKGIGDAQDVFSVTTVEYLDENKTLELSDYTNRVFGFSFAHPGTWLLSESGSSLTLNSEEMKVIQIQVFNDEATLDSFLDAKEDSEGEEVTIGAQRSVRYLSDGAMRFYVPNPPKKKIYEIKYTPTINKVDDEEGADRELELFYDFLESFELIYMTQLTGDMCGGLKTLECPEDYRCEYESGAKYAEGVCVPVGGDTLAANCPFISAPAGCYDYRIAEYSKNGCPTRFECVGSGGSLEGPSFRDLNIVDAGRQPDDLKVSEDSPDEEIESDYEIPDTADINQEYINNQKNFTLLYPKNWYFASFGASEGVLWKVGFSDKALEESNEAIITLSLLTKDSGRASKKIGDVYYVVDGPLDLAETMKAIADSIESF